jgi:diaminopimelate epimerase
VKTKRVDKKYNNQEEIAYEMSNIEYIQKKQKKGIRIELYEKNAYNRKNIKNKMSRSLACY